MFKRPSNSDPASLLPWYVNHTLSAAERDAVEAWLKTLPDAVERLNAINDLRATVSAQTQLSPSPRMRQQLLAQIRTRQRAPRLLARLAARPTWLIGPVVALLLLVTLWVIVQPGIALQWSVAGTGASAYRVYRAPVDSEQFNLISEIPARSDARAYSFTDITSLPGQTYTYVIEAVTVSGQTTRSPLAVGRGLDVLPAQLALILTSLVAGAAAMLLVGNASHVTSNRRPLGA